MATTYTASTGSGNAPAYKGGAGQLCVAYGSYALTAALVVNDVIQIVRMPRGAVFIGATMMATDLDTNGTPTITLALGDGGSTARFIAASTIAQAGGVTSTVATTGFGFTFTDEDTIDVLVAAGPATGAATGTITVAVTYFTP